MSINELKIQILESVGGLDQVQSEKVLDYIRRVVRSRGDKEDYLNFKRRAMLSGDDPSRSIAQGRSDER